MSFSAKDGKAFWNGKCIGIISDVANKATGATKVVDPEEWVPKKGDLALVNTQIMQGKGVYCVVQYYDERSRRVQVKKYGCGQHGAGEYYNLTSLIPIQIDESAREALIADVVKQTNKAKVKLDVQVSDEMRQLFKELGEGQWNFDNRLFEAHTHVAKLEKRIEKLEEQKLDKPSFSPELLAAEQYVDDFNEVRKKYRIQRFAQKQRTKRKLERIEKGNKHRQKRSWTSEVTYATCLILGITIAAIAAAF